MKYSYSGGIILPGVTTIKNSKIMEMDNNHSILSLCNYSIDDITFDIIKDVCLKASIFDNDIELAELLSDSKDNLNKIIVDCSVCDPYNTTNFSLILEKQEEILGGIKILSIGTGVKSADIVFSSNMKNIGEISKVINTSSKLISAKIVRPKYFQNDPSVLIETILGFQSVSRDDYNKHKCLCISASTCVAIYNAFVNHFAQEGRYISIYTGINNYVVYVPFNSTFEELLSFISLNYSSKMILDGTPIKSTPVKQLNVPIPKHTRTISIVDISKLKHRGFNSCNNCGKCYDICPKNINPAFIIRNNVHFSKLLSYDKTRCIKCNACSYVCPQRINLNHYLFEKGEDANG